MPGRSLEARLFEAWTHGRGCHLSADDVRNLLDDDAIATRLSNAAAGVETGDACLMRHMYDDEWTWARFCSHMRE